MHHDYHDIRDRIAEEPQWFDEHAVPRYCKFHPDETADIYCREACLLLIACQACGHQFRVALSAKDWWWDRGEFKSDPGMLARAARQKAIYWGDPPNIGCCAAGPTMTANVHEIVEFWRKNERYEWERVPALEGELWRP